MSLEVILWDNDGVLVNTEPQYFQASQEILADVGVQLTEEQFKDISLRRGESLMQLAPQDDVLALRIRRDNRYAELIQESVTTRDGVEDCLKALRGRVKMGIVTSSQQIHFDLIHEKTGFLQYFDFIVTRERYSQSKPHPDAYLTAIKDHSVIKEKAIVIEDTQRGLESAVAAGLKCIVVPHELSKDGDFQKAYKVLPSFKPLLSTLTDL